MGNQTAKPTAKKDRIAPYSEQDEKGFLGCLLLSEDCIDEAIETFKPGHEGFYDIKHQIIYKSILWLRADEAPVTLHTVFKRSAELMKGNSTEGLLAYIAELPDSTASAGNLGYHLGCCLELYRRRKLIQVCASIESEAYEGSLNGELLENAEKRILEIGNCTDVGRGVVDIEKLRIRLIDRYEAAMQGKQTGLMTGFIDLDRITGGMQPQDMIILMGQQSTGKTTLALNIATNVALAGTPVGILSLETSAEKLLHRIYASIAGVNGSKFMRGQQLLQWEMDAMSRAMGLVKEKEKNFLIDDTGGLTTDQMRAKGRRLRQKGAKLLVVDYMQLLNAQGTEYERITSVSRAIKECAKEGDWPVIAISSLNRQGASDEGKPRIRHARGSGQIDYDGNQFWLLSCEDSTVNPRTVNLEVAKNKDGETGELDLSFFTTQFKFKNAAKPEQPAGRQDD